MKPDNGHLVRIIDDLTADGQTLQELLEGGYQEVPAELVDEAEKELADSDEVYLDLKKESPLSQWARDQLRRKARRKDRNRRIRKGTKSSRLSKKRRS